MTQVITSLQSRLTSLSQLPLSAQSDFCQRSQSKLFGLLQNIEFYIAGFQAAEKTEENFQLDQNIVVQDNKENIATSCSLEYCQQSDVFSTFSSNYSTTKRALQGCTKRKKQANKGVQFIATDDVSEQKIQNLDKFSFDTGKNIPHYDVAKFFVGDFDVEKLQDKWRTVSTSTRYNQQKHDDFLNYGEIRNKTNLELKNKFEVLAKLQYNECD